MVKEKNNLAEKKIDYGIDQKFLYDNGFAH
jgi:hypothetical protein